MNRDPLSDSSFIYEGGNSLNALVFVDSVEVDLAQFSSQIQTIKLLDILLSQTFTDLVEYLQKQANLQRDETNESTSITDAKRPRITKCEIDSIGSEFTWISKHQSSRNEIDNQETLPSLNQQIAPSIEVAWSYDTKKCVDATPLLVRRNNQNLILIGSHSAEFFCIKDCGELAWSFKTEDRIESSAIVSKCGNFVIFGKQSLSVLTNTCTTVTSLLFKGCYDRHVYVLKIDDGALYFKVKTGDIVKSTPCLDFNTGHVYFGSYDQHLYCLSINVIEKSVDILVISL